MLQVWKAVAVLLSNLWLSCNLSRFRVMLVFSLLLERSFYIHDR